VHRPQPIAAEARKAALEAVDQDLAAVGLLDRIGGQLAPKAAAELSFEITSCLPTPPRRQGRVPPPSERWRPGQRVRGFP
jgi:hypothetical protein